MSPAADHDPYRGTTGLKDDFDGTIESVLFTYDSEYNDGKTCIARVEIRDHADPKGDPEVVKLSTGSGWEPAQKGQVAERGDGKDPQGFNRSCGYQIFFEGAFDQAEGTIRKAGLPWEAKTLTGLDFHFNQVEYLDMNDKKRNRLVPSAFLGKSGKSSKDDDTDDDEEPAKAKPASKSAAKDSNDDAAELPAKVKGKLKKFAIEADSHEEFMELAYSGLDDADTYDTVIDDDSDEGFYAQNHED